MLTELGVLTELSELDDEVLALVDTLLTLLGVLTELTELDELIELLEELSELGVLTELTELGELAELGVLTELTELTELLELELEIGGLKSTLNTRLANPDHTTAKVARPAVLVMLSPTKVNVCRPPWALLESQTNAPATLATLKVTALMTTSAVVLGAPVYSTMYLPAGGSVVDPPGGRMMGTPEDHELVEAELPLDELLTELLELELEFLVLAELVDLELELRELCVELLEFRLLELELRELCEELPTTTDELLENPSTISLMISAISSSAVTVKSPGNTLTILSGMDSPWAVLSEVLKTA